MIKYSDRKVTERVEKMEDLRKEKISKTISSAPLVSKKYSSNITSIISFALKKNLIYQT